MISAFRYGAPPHAGVAPGIDRIVMLLAGAENIREVIMFPMNQRAEDLMMGAPCGAHERAAARARDSVGSQGLMAEFSMHASCTTRARRICVALCQD